MNRNKIPLPPFRSGLTTRMVTVLGLASALMTAACSDGFGPTEPISAPTLSHQELGPAESTWASVSDHEDEVEEPEDIEAESLDNEFEEEESGQGGRKLVQSDLTFTVRTVSGVIGRDGGTLTLWAATSDDAGEKWVPYHSLTVPPGAVRRPTRFVMQAGSGPVIDVHLTATEVPSGRRITEFGQRLRLALSYAGSAVEDPSHLGVAYVVDEEIREFLPSVVDVDRKIVIAEIEHFSRYAVACE